MNHLTLVKQVLYLQYFYFQRLELVDDDTSMKKPYEHKEKQGNETLDSLFNTSIGNRNRTLSEIEFSNEVNEFANDFRYVCLLQTLDSLGLLRSHEMGRSLILNV